MVTVQGADIRAVLYAGRPQGYKKVFMLISVELEILNAHKYKNMKTFSIFQAQISLECYIFPAYKILTFMSRKNFMLSWVVHDFFYHNLGGRSCNPAPICWADEGIWTLY